MPLESLQKLLKDFEDNEYTIGKDLVKMESLVSQIQSLESEMENAIESGKVEMQLISKIRDATMRSGILKRRLANDIRTLRRRSEF